MNLHHIREALSATDADLSKSSFTNINLAESRFTDVNLTGATFSDANLSGIVCADVNLTGASISNANVTDMRINGILVDDLMRAYRAGGEHSMLRTASHRAAAVLYAKDVARLRPFYENVLELEVETTASDHVILASPAFRLFIVAIPAHIASSIQIGEPPALRSESPTKLVFSTRSIAGARATARGYGGDVLPAEREWEFEGNRLCDGNDPEGNVFQLREDRV